MREWEGSAAAGGSLGQPVEVFLSCSEAPNDKVLRDELVMHLAPLVRNGLVRVWHHDKVGAGEARRQAAEERLKSARFVLLLVSARYLASDDCRQEAEGAMARRGAGGAVVVPVLLSPALWDETLFRDLKPLPSRGPVTKWPSQDDALLEVVRELQSLIEKHDKKSSLPPPPKDGPESVGRSVAPKPSYADRLTKALSERLQGVFREKARLAASGLDTDAVANEILDLKRQLRGEGRLQAGDLLGHNGRYLLMSQLGRGGFALIWRARDMALGQDVAIKILRPDLAADPIRLQRFLRGARVMSRLSHPSIVRVLDVPTDDIGWYYYAMELLDGGDLREAVLAKRIGHEQVLSITLTVASALAEVHAARWVHRDVKPTNILLTEGNVPKLTDFDLVGGPETAGGTASPIGSPIFQAPELLIRPHESDARADVYSLGMTTLFALYGEDWTPDILRREHAQTLIGRLQCSEAVKEVLSRAVDFDVEKRFRDAAAYRDALARATNRKISVPPDPPPSDPFREVTAQHKLPFSFVPRGEPTPTPPPPTSSPSTPPRPTPTPPTPRPRPTPPPAPPQINPTEARTQKFTIDTPPVRDAPLLKITDAFLVMKGAPSSVAVNKKQMLLRSPTAIGREAGGEGGGIVLAHSSISRAHARIELRSFSLVVVDEGSTNGTFVGPRLPLTVRDRVFGVAMLHYGDFISFGREFVFQLEFWPHVGGEQHMREYERLKVDAKTGLPSRRYLLGCLTKEALRAQQHREALSFLVLQLVKRSGDPDPPVEGLLVDLARIVRQQLDTDQVIGRFGGRSIGVLLKGKTAEEASTLAAEVRGQAPPSMSIRFGAAESLIGDRDPPEALRNRVVAALDDPHGGDGEDL